MFSRRWPALSLILLAAASPSHAVITPGEVASLDTTGASASYLIKLRIAPATLSADAAPSPVSTLPSSPESGESDRDAANLPIYCTSSTLAQTARLGHAAALAHACAQPREHTPADPGPSAFAIIPTTAATFSTPAHLADLAHDPSPDR